MPAVNNTAAGQYQARYLGFVFSTTECGVAARSDDGHEAYVSMPMEAKCSWNGWPAHYLQHVPVMMAAVLKQLLAKGWSFNHPGYVSQAWRQHDLAILGCDDTPLIPAPSWQCNGAKQETKILNKGVPELISATGRVESRFAVSKLPWVLRMAPELKNKIDRVMLSGDWVNGMLTGTWRLSASDAICNGLLDLKTKTLAADGLRAANKIFQGRLNPGWFPEVVGSKDIVGRVRTSNKPEWDTVTRLLSKWNAVASLGDNQATAAGCGTAGHSSIAISMGTSGTVNRPCPTNAGLRGQALRFEYWDDQLLMLMLPACAAWYDLFRKSYQSGYSLKELNDLSLTANFKSLRRLQPQRSLTELHERRQLDGMKAENRVASTQCSIAMEMLARVQTMVREVKKPPLPVKRYILTGGLGKAPLIQYVLYRGLQHISPNAEVLLNDRKGALAHKTDALGAIYNAIMARSGKDLATVIESDSRLKIYKRMRSPDIEHLDRFIDSCR